MAEFSNYLEAKLLDHVLRNVNFTSPTTAYIGLYTVAPDDTGGGTEVSGGSYARQAASFSAASGGLTTTDADITFPQATGNWGTVVALGIHDSVVTGNLLMYTDLTASKTIESGDILKVATGSLTVTLD
jgi:hypothetical protein